MGSGSMGLLSGVALLLLLLPLNTQSVYIHYKGFKVQLESVKKLINLEDDQVTNDRNFPPPVCRHPALPLDLQPVCTSQEAVSIFSSLRSIATDNCELCVNVACTGCF
ncbi:guanylate cyclase activator 2B [Ochotona curzoniae]|uniref:guanylate cyclase activator 2B n=1 Tax=Ochotona curzoniae TaxID=130825 RepID=UPI001B349BC6|nr:guanylate cyclase activator 2B [Ochotona curzoniae]